MNNYNNNQMHNTARKKETNYAGRARKGSCVCNGPFLLVLQYKRAQA